MEGGPELDGKVLGGRYRLKDVLGKGGMGTVYTAVQTSLGRPVAIKVLLPVLSTDPALVARFKGEAEQAGRLSHPNIVEVLDFGREEDGSVWLAMELLKGEPLAQRMERGPMSEAEVVGIAQGSLAGLAAAHAVPLIHRDLKPDNIFLKATPGVGDVVKILDFGIAKLLDGDSAAKLTATGLIIGTPLYMSPEQARGEDDIDARSDLYSLGAVMYEALTGHPPLTGNNYNALLVAVLTGTPRPITELRPDLSPELAAVVTRALAKDKKERFASADEMSQALSAFTPKTDTPASRSEIALASTVATPQPALPPTAVTPAPTETETETETAGAEPAIAATQPATTPTPATAPPTPAPAEPRGARNYGWLMPAMMLTTLLAGVAGTYAFMQSGEDAVRNDPVTVVPVGGSPIESGGAPPDVDAAPAPTEAPEGEPSGNSETSVRDDANEEEEGEGEGEPSPRLRGPRVRIEAMLSLMEGHRDWRQQGNLRGHYDWSRCWPRNRPFPPNNWVVMVEAETTAEGDLVPGSYGPVGYDSYRDVRLCLQSHLDGVNLGPSRTGEGGRVRMSFELEPVGR